VGSGLSSPDGVAVDGVDNVFIADTGNSRAVVLQRSLPPSLSFASSAVGTSSPLASRLPLRSYAAGSGTRPGAADADEHRSSGSGWETRLAIVLLAASLGVRASEIAGLRLEDLD